MKFLAFMIGLSILIIGLLGYALIPNVHTIPVQSSSDLPNPPPVVVYPNSQYETHQNITVYPGKINEMIVNLTVSTGTASVSSIEFKLSTEAQEATCMRDTDPTGCLVDRSVSNQSITVPLNASSIYYFAFNNRDPMNQKTVQVSSVLLTRSVTSFVTRDGQSNYAALGLGVVGLFIAAYGVAAKTVIPWE